MLWLLPFPDLMRFLFLKLPSLITRTLFYLAVFLTPVLGVWLASSLVAYVNGPTLLTAFSGQGP
ncbi:MAG: hypothetical protein EA342_06840 [Leptolyngbya sp. LCM1.Bin17]|nr:MAG: hypothetical protein EA342_06840 [Leptolyngbya sp. LCM1.Bin17]